MWCLPLDVHQRRLVAIPTEVGAGHSPRNDQPAADYVKPRTYSVQVRGFTLLARLNGEPLGFLPLDEHRDQAVPLLTDVYVAV